MVMTVEMLVMVMIPRIAAVCFRNRGTIGILIPLKEPHHVWMIDLPQAAFRQVYLPYSNYTKTPLNIRWNNGVVHWRWCITMGVSDLSATPRFVLFVNVWKLHFWSMNLSRPKSSFPTTMIARRRTNFAKNAIGYEVKIVDLDSGLGILVKH